MIARFDNLGNQLAPLGAVLSMVRSFEVGSTQTLAITTLSEIGKEDRVVFADELGRFREFIVEDVSQDGDGIREAHAVESCDELVGDYIVERRPSGDAGQLLAAALEPSRWEVGEVGVQGTAQLSWYHTSSMAAILEICEALGCEMWPTVEVEGGAVTHRRINLGTQGRDSGKRFSSGRDLAGVRRTVENNKIYTRVYGYGKGVERYDASGQATGGYSRKITFGDMNGGLDYVESAEALERWGRPDGRGGMAHVTGKVEFGDCEDPEELLRLTTAWAEAQYEPRVSYEADVVRLSHGGFDASGVAEGDTVQIVDSAFDPPLRLQGRVMAGEVDELDRSLSTYTLGNIAPGVSDELAAQRREQRDLASRAGAWDSAASLPTPYLDQLIARLNQEFDAGGSYKFESWEQGTIYSSVPLDEAGRPTRTPATAMQLTGRGFRIANEVDALGEWVWRTFGDGDGFTADQLVAGTIVGGASRWNLETGELHTERMEATDIEATGSFHTTSEDMGVTVDISADDGLTVRSLDDGEIVAQMRARELTLGAPADPDKYPNESQVRINGDDLVIHSSVGLVTITTPHELNLGSSTGNRSLGLGTSWLGGTIGLEALDNSASVSRYAYVNVGLNGRIDLIASDGVFVNGKKIG